MRKIAIYYREYTSPYQNKQPQFKHMCTALNLKTLKDAKTWYYRSNLRLSAQNIMCKFIQ